MRGRSAGLLGVLLSCALAAAPAHAQEAAARRASSGSGARAPALRVLLRNCSGFRDVEVERVLAAELATETRPEVGAREPTFIIVGCTGNRVELEVHDLLSRKTVQRRFDFGSAIPAARARLIALAAAELVLASWAELAFLPKPRIEPEGEAPDPETQRAAAKRAERKGKPRRSEAEEPAPANEQPAGAPERPLLLLGTEASVAREERGPRGERIIYGDYTSERLPGRNVLRLAALASTRTFTNREGSISGLGLRLGSDLYPLHGWSVDALFESGTLRANGSGDVRLDSFSIGAALGWLFEIGNRLTLRAGGGLRGGVARASYAGRTAATGVVWGWPMLAVSGTGHFGPMNLEVSSEAGYTGLTFGPVAPAIQGVWLSAQLGFGVRL